MPTTLIFGASRGLGRAFTHHALSQGHRVVALVRNPEMATELGALGVEVIEGDALDLAAVQQACVRAGQDAQVVSTLGSFRQTAPVDYQGNRHVIDAMEQAGLKRLLLVTSLGCGDSWQYLPERARAAFGHEVRLKSLAESWLQTSSLAWTILRPAGLQDGDATDRATLSQDKEVHGLVRRADVAVQGLCLLADETAVGQIYAIGDPTLQRG
ncbi:MULTISPECIES: NAD(P)-dependent oxidoreductase [Aeromonas]|uniref:NAD(P)-dependent oxidoreductase n=1 Tax=Aeromonas TaxID=642 RepID=UPI0018F20897|nr:SDR family oxidoreductase [Aeromonas veronii]MBJ7583750.1 SDR family oxidoreductase [Aeromonas veronii]MEB5668816.1 SDR family oxidoreductase [Aeromonas veronii]HDX8427326.1 SDR family oxidoreductase [Aeromonas veronii]